MNLPAVAAVQGNHFIAGLHGEDRGVRIMPDKVFDACIIQRPHLHAVRTDELHRAVYKLFAFRHQMDVRVFARVHQLDGRYRRMPFDGRGNPGHIHLCHRVQSPHLERMASSVLCVHQHVAYADSCETAGSLAFIKISSFFGQEPFPAGKAGIILG